MPQIAQGFSPANRCLLYLSVLMSPAQWIAGRSSISPCNLGSLALNWYSQLQIFRAAKAQNLDALATVILSLNMFLNLTYVGGATASHVAMSSVLFIGTAGLIVLNETSAWLAYVSLGDDLGQFDFWCFGWRTLNGTWYKVQLGFGIVATLAACFCILFVGVHAFSDDDGDDRSWWGKYVALPVGAAVMMFLFWMPIVMIEVTVARNHIESETDMISVWVFLAQVVTFFLP